MQTILVSSIFWSLLLGGCAKRLEVVYYSSPPGASITYDLNAGGQNTVTTPRRLVYGDLDDNSGCTYIQLPSVTWPDGITIPKQKTTLCSREYTFYKPSRPAPPQKKPEPVSSESNYFKNLDTERLCRVVQIGVAQDVLAARRELATRGANCQAAVPVREEVKVPSVRPPLPPPVMREQPRPVAPSAVEIKRQKCIRLGLIPGSGDYLQCVQ
jgi:hypothetical protein